MILIQPASKPKSIITHLDQNLKFSYAAITFKIESALINRDANLLMVFNNFWKTLIWVKVFVQKNAKFSTTGNTVGLGKDATSNIVEGMQIF